ncbi:hypothetical protein V6N11_024387 [Hibiscus sabdariffa]|uniref:Uncharacterized protein n=1 Tax=Hibiscus sabdariffa TaxID=183260 RepID=A0ABR2NFI7_9ROSI
MRSLSFSYIKFIAMLILILFQCLIFGNGNDFRPLSKIAIHKAIYASVQEMEFEQEVELERGKLWRMTILVKKWG